MRAQGGASVVEVLLGLLAGSNEAEVLSQHGPRPDRASIGSETLTNLHFDVWPLSLCVL